MSKVIMIDLLISIKKYKLDFLNNKTHNIFKKFLIVFVIFVVN